MFAGLDSGDRKLLIGAAALLVLMTTAALLLSPPPGEEDQLIVTTYAAGSSGAKAAYLLLKELNYDVQRWEQSPSELPQEPTGVTLILVQPFVASSAEERQAVHRFVRNGGHLLAAALLDPRLIPEVPPRTGVDFGQSVGEWKEFHPQAASPLVEGAATVKMAEAPRFRSADHEYIPVYGDDTGAVVVTYRVGEGRVTLWAAATPLTNAGIQHPGNLALFLNSLGPPAGPVLWDEFYHGHQGTLWTYLSRTPVAWALVQIGVAALAVILGFARRHGPARAPERESRLSPLEFVSTLGGLYQRAGASAAAVGIAYQRFRYLLSKRLGLAPTASAARLHQGAREQLGWKQPGLLELLQRCERAPHDAELNDTAALSMVQGLAHYTELLRLGSRASATAAAAATNAAPENLNTQGKP